LKTGPHYYVLSLGGRANVLFEAFRDTLINIENGGFPVIAAEGPSAPGATGEGDRRRQDTLRTVDRCFGAYHRQEPLRLVITGEEEALSMFSELTAYQDAVVGCVVGDYSETSLRDLGKIVWPVVRYAISGIEDRALHDIETAASRHRIVSGIEAVSRELGAAMGATLIVEADYHLRGTVYELGATLKLSPEIDVMATMDDVVDVVIEKTLSAGGHVVFVASGVLKHMHRMVLLLGQEG
jgi:hypothetical protein